MARRRGASTGRMSPGECRVTRRGVRYCKDPSGRVRFKGGGGRAMFGEFGRCTTVGDVIEMAELGAIPLTACITLQSGRPGARRTTRTRRKTKRRRRRRTT